MSHGGLGAEEDPDCTAKPRFISETVPVLFVMSRVTSDRDMLPLGLTEDM